ncbi:FxSxx-COOH system tetratricopeptide repeat protein [Streptomyces sp. NPDC006012]|uniref:FxSxx-COOH system tetratricopeptide repeat protein n=1 Tax=Streptomyces sp. NPDC006012 TaxID=3364739 RepID=UPI0036881DAA
MAAGLGAALAALAAAWGYSFATDRDGGSAPGERSIVVDTGGGDVLAPFLTGDNSHVVQLPPGELRPMAEVEAPPGLDDLPVRPGTFVGRTRELDRLDAALAAPGQVVVQAVHGLGGIGKSTVAAHWAATRARGHAPIRWITADSSTGVEQGLAGLASALQPALAHALSVEQLAERAVQWLATHTGWLIILDNVNDPADIAPLIARAPGGRFLITSRLANAWTDEVTLIRLDVLQPAESLALFTRITTGPHPGRDLDGAADLCDELGHLPLAIEQAAAYLAQNPFATPRGYLHLLAQSPADMYRQGSVTTPAERTIARIWNITLDRIATQRPDAADLLRTLAWYAPENIPATLADLFADAATSTSAIGVLNAYNMITADGAAHALAVHRLVQSVARTPDPDDHHRTPELIDQARNRATNRLAHILDTTGSDPANWPTWRTLLPHIDALADHTAMNTDTIATAFVLNQAGTFLDGQGLSDRAIAYFERSITSGEREGAHVAVVLLCRKNLAAAYQSAGRLDEAIALHEQNLQDAEQAPAADDLDLLGFRNGLAAAYQSAGRLDEAIALHEQNLQDAEQAPAADRPRDPDLLTIRNNLANAYHSAGRVDEAIALHERNLQDAEQTLDADDSRFLAVRNNLAGVYVLTGRGAQAIPLQERDLEVTERVLGLAHRDTLNTRDNLASTYAMTGNAAKAVELCEQSLHHAEQEHGAFHSLTLTSRNNLVMVYVVIEDLARARQLHERNLSDAERELGADHSVTQTIRVTDEVLAQLAAGRRRR